MNVLRRHVGIGLVVTAVDVVLLVVGVRAAGWSAPVADAVAVGVATLVSFVGHRDVAFGSDPSRRFFRNRLQYVLAAVATGCLDVAVLTLITGTGDVSTRLLLGAKVVSLGIAFVVRVFLSRQALAEAIRGDQQQPIRRSTPPGDVRLSVVIPAYMEAAGIGDTVTRVRDELAAVAADGGLEVVVVDDGSTDGTAGAARAAGADVVLSLEPNRGKGAAVRAGMLAAHGRCRAFTDADLSYAPGQIIGLMNRVESGWDAVVGSRKHTETRTLVETRRLREVGGRVVNLFTSLVLLGNYRDTQCGLKAFRSDVAELVFTRTTIDGFAFDVEVFHLVERYRLTLCEVPVELVNSTRSTVKVARDGARLLRDLFRIRRTSRRGGYEVDPGDVPVGLQGPRVA